MRKCLTILSPLIPALFVLWGCESSGSIKTESTTSRLIDNPSADTVNQAVRDDVETVLVVRLDIRQNQVSIGAARFARVPKSYLNTGAKRNQLLIKAIDEQRRIVGQASAADGSVNVQEGRGQVILDTRSVSVAVPVVKAPAQLAVFLQETPDAPISPIFLDVAEDSKLYCEKFPQDGICNSTNTETLPKLRLDSVTEAEAIVSPPGQ